MISVLRLALEARPAPEEPERPRRPSAPAQIPWSATEIGSGVPKAFSIALRPGCAPSYSRDPGTLGTSGVGVSVRRLLGRAKMRPGCRLHFIATSKERSPLKRIVCR